MKFGSKLVFLSYDRDWIRICLAKRIIFPLKIIKNSKYSIGIWNWVTSIVFVTLCLYISLNMERNIEKMVLVWHFYNLCMTDSCYFSSSCTQAAACSNFWSNVSKSVKEYFWSIFSGSDSLEENSNLRFNSNRLHCLKG